MDPVLLYQFNQHIHHINVSMCLKSVWVSRLEVLTAVNTIVHRVTTFRSTTDRIYNGGKNFWKLEISQLWRKITFQSKSSIWMKPPYCGNRCVKGLSSIRRSSQCWVYKVCVSTFSDVRTMTKSPNDAFLRTYPRR